MNFNTATVARITGLTKRQIGYWDTTDLIKPSVQGAEGYGTTRLYSFIDLVQLMVAKRLLDSSVSIQKLRKALWYLKKNMPDIEKPLADLCFLTDGKTSFVITKDDQQVLDTLRNGQLVLTLALGKIVEDLKGEVDAINARKRYGVRVKGMKYSVILHMDTEDGGYWVECPAIPGCASQGDTVEEALGMIKDAIQACADVQAEKDSTQKAS
ncbi:MAG: MerR family transcriptional regulator [Deltaproteobacteria bacterium]|nr:MerR family transcriptional regulator [Deltaproteobacteria bacterium]